MASLQGRWQTRHAKKNKGAAQATPSILHTIMNGWLMAQLLTTGTVDELLLLGVNQ